MPYDQFIVWMGYTYPKHKFQRWQHWILKAILQHPNCLGRKIFMLRMLLQYLQEERNIRNGQTQSTQTVFSRRDGCPRPARSAEVGSNRSTS